MVRKFVGFASVLAVTLAFAGCGTASTQSDDHCTVDPNAADCASGEPEEPAVDPAGEP